MRDWQTGYRNKYTMPRRVSEMRCDARGAVRTCVVQAELALFPMRIRNMSVCFISRIRNGEDKVINLGELVSVFY